MDQDANISLNQSDKLVVVDMNMSMPGRSDKPCSCSVRSLSHHSNADAVRAENICSAPFSSCCPNQTQIRPVSLQSSPPWIVLCSDEDARRNRNKLGRYAETREDEWLVAIVSTGLSSFVWTCRRKSNDGCESTGGDVCRPTKG